MANNRDRHSENSDRRWFRSLRAWLGCLREPIAEFDVLVSVLAILAGLAGLVVFGSIVFQFVAALADPSGNFESARNLGLILAAVIGLPFVVWRSWIGERQARASLRQAETAEENVVTNSFTRAIDQLGATREEKKDDGTARTVPNLEVRLGALYALERLYNTSAKDQAAIADIIAAYVRENSGAPRDVRICLLKDDERAIGSGFDKTSARWWGAYKDAIKNLDPPREDVQTALSILCRSCTSAHGSIGHTVDWSRLDATQTDLSDAMKPGLDMRMANLLGANLASAQMDNVNLRLADLRGANLSWAKLSEAVLWQAKLQAVNLDMAILEGAVLRYAQLKGASLRSAGMANTDLTRADMACANVEQTDFTRAVLYSVNLASSRGLTQQQIDSVWEGDAATGLPASIRRPAHWPNRQLLLLEIDQRLALHRAGRPPPQPAI